MRADRPAGCLDSSCFRTNPRTEGAISTPSVLPALATAAVTGHGRPRGKEVARCWCRLRCGEGVFASPLRLPTRYVWRSQQIERFSRAGEAMTEAMAGPVVLPDASGQFHAPTAPTARRVEWRWMGNGASICYEPPAWRAHVVLCDKALAGARRYDLREGLHVGNGPRGTAAAPPCGALSLARAAGWTMGSAGAAPV